MRAAGRGGACACLLVLASARLVPTAAWAARGLHLAGGKASRQPRVEGAMNSAAQTDQRCQLALPPVVLGTFQLKGDLVKGIVRAGLDQVLLHHRDIDVKWLAAPCPGPSHGAR